MEIDNFKYSGRDLEAMSFAYNYHKWIFEEFNLFIGDNVIEVGAGSGNFSEMILQTNIKKLITLEPSKNMFMILSNRLNKYNNILTYNSFFKDHYNKLINKCDTIIYNNVLEHIKDDRLELKYIYKSLRSEGYLCLFIPALTWLYSEFDKSIGHYRRYEKKTLLEKLKTAGFKIIKAKYMDSFGIIIWYFVFVILRKKLISNHVKYYDKFVIPILKRIEKIINIPIGKNLLIVAQKK